MQNETLVKAVNWDDVLQEAQAARKAVALLPVQERLIRAMQKVFRKQERVFLRELRKLRTEFSEALEDKDLDDIMIRVSGETTQDMGRALMESGAESMSLAGGHMLDDLGINIAFDLQHPRAVSFLANNAALKVSQVNDTTKARMRTILTQATEEGWSYDKTAKEISNRWAEFRVGKPQLHIDSRAHLVAVTESANAYEEGNLQAARQIAETGIQLEKSWLDSHDGRVSDGCLANAADGWIDIEESFSSGDLRSPRFPGCRCDVRYRRARPKTPELPPIPVSELNTAVQRAEAQIMAQYAKKRVEHCAALDAQGRTILTKSGKVSQIKFTGEEMRTMQGAQSITHNHPSGSSFSVDDLLFGRDVNARQLTVITDKHRYTIAPSGDNWGTLANIRARQKALDVEISPIITAQIKAGTITPDQGLIIHQHYVISKLAEEYNLIYNMEALP